MYVYGEGHFSVCYIHSFTAQYDQYPCVIPLDEDADLRLVDVNFQAVQSLHVALIKLII